MIILLHILCMSTSTTADFVVNLRGFLYLVQPVTQGDITGYQVYYNGTMINVNSSTTTLTFNAPSLLDDVFTGTVVVMVTAVNQFGVGPVSDNVSAMFTGKYT